MEQVSTYDKNSVKSEKVYIAPSAEVDVPEPTHSIEYDRYGEYGTGVAIVDARPIGADGQPDGPVWVMAMSMDARTSGDFGFGTKASVEPEVMQVFAEANGAMVVGIDHPGISMTRRQELEKGYKGEKEFAPIPFERAAMLPFDRSDWASQEMWKAYDLATAEKVGSSQPRNIIGFGLSDLTAAAMADTAKGPIGHIVMIEPLNGRPWDFLKVLGIGDEQAAGVHHFENNKLIEWYGDEVSAEKKQSVIDWIEAVKRRQAILVGLGAAAMIRPFMPVLKHAMSKNAAANLRDADITFIRFGESGLSQQESIEKSASDLASKVDLGRGLGMIAVKEIGVSGGKEELRFEARQSLAVMRQIGLMLAGKLDKHAA